MRLIDADALVADCQLAQKQADRHGREFANAFYSGGGEISTEWWCVEDMIENAPTIEERKTGRWIPCSERLPEEKINPNTQDYDWVLCSTSFGDVRAYHFGRGKFLHGCGDVTQYVIAWQPMPEPYREDKHEYISG